MSNPGLDYSRAGSPAAALSGNLRFSIASLVITNLIPLWGVLFRGWQVFDVMFIFWCENLVIGAFNVLRLLAVNTKGNLVAAGGKIFAAVFFTFHYGIFCFAHGVFVLAIFADALGFRGGPVAPEVQAGAFPNPFAAFVQLGVFGPYFPAILAMVVSHGISFFVNYLGSGENRRVTTQMLMRQPYARIVVLHVTIIFGGMAVLALGSPVAALVLLIVLKVGVDIAAHRVEHRRFGSGLDESAIPEEDLPAEERLRQAIERERGDDAARKGNEP